MSETTQAQIDMVRRDVLELRSVDERQERAIEGLRGDTDHLKSQQRQIFEQQMEHAKLLLRHAELHVQHSEQISAARDQARQATQSASELAREWRDAAQAIDRHVSGVAKSNAEVVGKLGEKVDKLVTAQEQDRNERKLQTVALNKLSDAVKSPLFAVYVGVGGIAGGALVAIFERIFR